MFFRILKKEFKRKKGVNTILFLFIIIATIFVASSVNNILVVSNATQYCMDKGNVPDDSVWTYESDHTVNLDDWLDGDGSAYIDNYVKNESVAVSQENIKDFQGKEGKKYQSIGSIFICSQWDTDMQIFNQNQKLADVEIGQIAMRQSEMDKNGLKIGDTITFEFGDYTKKFVITDPILDPAFGGDYVGMTRYLVSEQDYRDIVAAGAQVTYTYGIETKNVDQFSREMNRQGITTIVELSRDLFEMTYVMSMITAGILIIIGICLIIIAFLILRFTIVVTIQEEYRQIGIMKAIGIRDFGIKKIYLVKYFALAFFASVLGCIFSVPVSSWMLKSVSAGMMMQDGTANIGINLICAAAVLIVILIFCYLSTNRLKKVSAIEAIRNGGNGERFRKKAGLVLYRHKTAKVPLFLAFNDIFSSIKKYVVLILTFMIGTILIVLPLNTITTMQSKEMAKNFVLDTDADFFIDPVSVFSVKYALTKDSIEENVKKLQTAFSKKGYDTDVSTMLFYSVPVYAAGDEKDIRNFMAMQFTGTDIPDMEMIEGSAPKEDNEMAMSEKAMEKLGVGIGDTVCVSIDGEYRNMVVSGSYQNFMQMGVSILLPDTISPSETLISGNWYLQVRVKNAHNSSLIEDVKKAFPSYEIYDMQQAMNQQLGGTISQIGIIKNGIILLICAVNALITILMMKIFIIGETNQLAMLRSIGFSIRAVRLSQSIRMGIVLMAGVVSGTILSIPLNTLILRPIFGMMGATHIKIQIDPLENYIVYPGLLLLVVLITAYISSASIRKLNLMEINNVE